MSLELRQEGGGGGERESLSPSASQEIWYGSSWYRKKLLFPSASFPPSIPSPPREILSIIPTNVSPRIGARDKVPLSYYPHCLLSVASAELTGNWTRYSIVDCVIVFPFRHCNLDFPSSPYSLDWLEGQENREDKVGREKKVCLWLKYSCKLVFESIIFNF